MKHPVKEAMDLADKRIASQNPFNPVQAVNEKQQMTGMEVYKRATELGVYVKYLSSRHVSWNSKETQQPVECELPLMGSALLKEYSQAEDEIVKEFVANQKAAIKLKRKEDREAVKPKEQPKKPKASRMGGGLKVVKLSPNPCKKGSVSHSIYEKILLTDTVDYLLQKGIPSTNLRYHLQKGHIELA